MKDTSYEKLDQLYKSMYKIVDEDEEQRNMLIQGNLDSLKRNIVMFNNRSIEGAFHYVAVTSGALLANATSKAVICTYIDDKNVALDIMNFLDNEFCVYMKDNPEVKKAFESRGYISEAISNDLLGYNALVGIELVVERIFDDDLISGEDKVKLATKYILPFIKNYSRKFYFMI